MSYITKLSADEGQIAVYLDGTLKMTNAASTGHNLGGQAIFTMSGLSQGSHSSNWSSRQANTCWWTHSK